MATLLRDKILAFMETQEPKGALDSELMAEFGLTRDQVWEVCEYLEARGLLRHYDPDSTDRNWTIVK